MNKRTKVIRSKASVLIVRTDGSNLKKSNEGWENLRERAANRGFSNRVDATLHSGRFSK